MRVITTEGIEVWLDAQHQCGGIAQQARLRPAPRVVASLADMGHSRPTLLPAFLPTLRRGEEDSARVASGEAAAQGLVGRKQGRR